ncbi:MAG: hypothetical protein JWR16_2902 [Nevskia sp.]|nr:hypothetical protein [Nevskia sp.]
MPKSILVAKAKTEKFTCRISQELHGRIQDVQAKLKILGNDAVFPLDQIVEETLQRATRLAETELSKRSPDDHSPPRMN